MIKEISKEREVKENESNIIRDFLISVAKEEKVEGAMKSKSQSKSNHDSSKKLEFDKSTVNTIVKRLK